MISSDVIFLFLDTLVAISHIISASLRVIYFFFIFEGLKFDHFHHEDTFRFFGLKIKIFEA